MTFNDGQKKQVSKWRMGILTPIDVHRTTLKYKFIYKM